MTFLNSWTYSSHVLPPCSIIRNCFTFFSSSNVSPKSFLIFVNNPFVVSISDSLLASSSSKLFFYTSATPPCTYYNTQTIWVVAASLFIFILKYRRAALMNMLTFSIFPLNIRGLVTSTLLPCCWRSIMLTCCCRVAIIERSFFSLLSSGKQGTVSYSGNMIIM